VGEVLDRWCDPIFGEQFDDVPAALAARLAEMATDLTAGEDVAKALDEARIRDPPPNLAAETPVHFAVLPKGMRIYYERLGSLLALAGIARGTNIASFDRGEPPARDEKLLGHVIGQAFHQGCSLADVALASGLDPEQVVAIGKRTIRRTKWLDRL